MGHDPEAFQSAGACPGVAHRSIVGPGLISLGIDAGQNIVSWQRQWLRDCERGGLRCVG